MTLIMLCTGNTCRSPMAEAVMRNALAEAGVTGVAVRSAGLCASEGASMSTGAERELKRRGVPFSHTRSTRLDSDMAKRGLILCMTGWQVKDVLRLYPSAKAMTLNECAGLPGDIGDPYGGGEYAYRRAADQIEEAVARIIARLGRNDYVSV